jgi:DNA-binding NarL/FixJ family response regulator
VSEAWPQPAGDIGVLVVDDHAVVRRGLAAYLESAEGIEVLAEAVDGKDALTSCSDSPPKAGSRRSCSWTC